MGYYDLQHNCRYPPSDFALDWKRLGTIVNKMRNLTQLAFDISTRYSAKLAQWRVFIESALSNSKTQGLLQVDAIRYGSCFKNNCPNLR